MTRAHTLPNEYYFILCNTLAYPKWVYYVCIWVGWTLDHLFATNWNLYGKVYLMFILKIFS